MKKTKLFFKQTWECTMQPWPCTNRKNTFAVTERIES